MGSRNLVPSCTHVVHIKIAGSGGCCHMEVSWVIWVMEVPPVIDPNHPFGFSIRNQPAIGDPPWLWKPPYKMVFKLVYKPLLLTIVFVTLVFKYQKWDWNLQDGAPSRASSRSVGLCLWLISIGFMVDISRASLWGIHSWFINQLITGGPHPV